MGLREVRSALVAALLTASGIARSGIARADADLDVVRADGLERCPDAAQIRQVAATFVAPSSPPPTHSYRVSFERYEGKLRAQVDDDTAGRTRRLEDSGTECLPLGQAVAVVLATMWSSEKSQPDPVPVPPPPLPPAPRPAIAAPVVRPRWFASEGPALAVAVVRPVAAALRADVGVALGHVSMALGALWLPEQHLDVAPGVVDVQLFAGNLRACAFVAFRAEIGVCANGYAGGLFASGSGYTSETPKTRPWLAIGPELYLDGPVLWRLLRVRVSAAALVPLHAETFSVAGEGSAYDTPPVGGLFSLSLEQVN